MDRHLNSSGTHLPGIVGPDQIDYLRISEIGHCRSGSGRRGKHKTKIKDLICTFDIETTRIEGDQSIMYIWQAQIGEQTVIGRTWDEALYMFERLSRAAAKKEHQILVFVHNLYYEFQFLSGILEPENVFSTAPRRVLKFDWKCLEFRCSYLLTNMSLGKFTQRMEVPDPKLKDFDYGKKRYPWTALTDDELLYCVNDVRGLAQALEKKLVLDGDNLATMPLTSTGYVRREAKKAMKRFNWHQLHDMLPSLRIYKLAREAFRGGDTHASRFYANRTITNVQSWDRSSSYPEVMINHEFPASQFWILPDKVTTYERVIQLIEQGKALLMRVCLLGPALKDPLEGCPYIPRSKCRHLVDPVLDNGRIISARYLEITITDIDLAIILDQYTYEEVSFATVAYARYRKLPQPLRELIQDLYEKKTALKGVEGQEFFYNKSKELLNSIYGMSAQDPGKPDVLYDLIKGFYLGEEISEEDFKKKMYNAFLSYTWAPWVTAWARYELHLGRMLAGRRFVYCDTDSVKFTADPALPWPMPDFTDYNQHKIRLAEKAGSWADDPSGRRHYMGVYEYEGNYQKFRTLGAKKYCSEKEGKLELTCAGVGKKSGAAELEKAGGIEAFQIGFKFAGEAGGLEAVYNDHTDFMTEVDGHEIHVTNNICLKPSTYTVGITADYDLAIRKAAKIMRRFK